MEPGARVRREPTAPVFPVVSTPDDVAACADALAAGSGPIAVDAERAGGYRYTQRAYLLQFHRRGTGIWLVDPIAVPDLAALADVINPEEWVLHAASQDLPCLAEVGLRPASLFDTELAGRLLNLERVGLSAMTEQFLDVALAKSHSAADWSRRPLPAAWLSYAALDVELLLDLADLLREELLASARHEWAAQEFEAARTAPPPSTDPERWRRVKRLKAQSPRGLAVAREMWRERDELARELDRTPTKILPDATIAAAAAAPPQTDAAFLALPGMTDQSGARQRRWRRAIDRALALPDAELPPRRRPTSSVPDPRNWDRIDPALAASYERVRSALTERAEDLDLPRENLISPAAVRTVVWQVAGPDATLAPGTDPTGAEIATALAAAGARRWQVDNVTETIAQALAAQED